MTGDELKAWREASGLSQVQAAERFGVSRPTLTNWEAGRRPVPDDVAAQVREGAQPPAVQRKPEPKPRPAEPAAIAQEARAQVQAMTDKPPPHLRGQNARRPTAQERREFPHRFAGPNVWVVENDPPKPNGFGSLVRLAIYRFSENGHGWPSLLLVGSRGKRNPDKEALAAFRPFRTVLGQPLTRGPGGGGGARKAA